MKQDSERNAKCTEIRSTSSGTEDNDHDHIRVPILYRTPMFILLQEEPVYLSRCSN